MPESMFNADQRAHMDYIESIAPELRCWCGWYDAVGQPYRLGAPASGEGEAMSDRTCSVCGKDKVTCGCDAPDFAQPAPPAHGSPELDEDAAKLEAIGADPGPTLSDYPASDRGEVAREREKVIEGESPEIQGAMRRFWARLDEIHAEKFWDPDKGRYWNYDSKPCLKCAAIHDGACETSLASAEQPVADQRGAEDVREALTELQSFIDSARVNGLSSEATSYNSALEFISRHIDDKLYALAAPTPLPSEPAASELKKLWPWSHRPNQACVDSKPIFGEPVCKCGHPLSCHDIEGCCEQLGDEKSTWRCDCLKFEPAAPSRDEAAKPIDLSVMPRSAALAEIERETVKKWEHDVSPRGDHLKACRRCQLQAVLRRVMGG